jgi:group II intron reverse transcriptase/maturase
VTIHRIDGKTWQTKLARIALLAKKKKELVFNNLGSIIDIKMLRYAYASLEANKAVGIDKICKEQYGTNLNENLAKLLVKIRRGTYQPHTAKIVEIPKDDGSTRPLAISCFEDKIVQYCVNMILTTIFEPLFLNCSFGFREDRNCHDALKELTAKTYQHYKGGMIEIDIQQCFNSFRHDLLIKALEWRICDRRFLRLLEYLIKTPITGGQERPTIGCPQGPIVSPTLANIFLHYGIDLWLENNKRQLQGEVVLIRYADDMIFIFQNPQDAQKIWEILPKRLKSIGLEMHQDKSNILPSGHQSVEKWILEGKNPPTFQFLRFTCYWGKARAGFWRIKYRSRADRFRKAVKRNKEFLAQTLNTHDIKGTLLSFSRRICEWINYHNISDNQSKVRAFLRCHQRLLYRWLNRKSQEKIIAWEHMKKWLADINFPTIPKVISMFSKRA